MSLKKNVTACGVISAVVWLAATLITRGLPLGFCRNISGILPRFLRDEVMKMANGFYYDVANRQMPQAAFIFLFTLLFILYLGSFLAVKKHPVSCASVIIFFGILFRLVVLPGVLIHENDIYRYIWDGKVLLSGVNPYKYAPHSAEAREGKGGQQELREIKRLKGLREDNITFFNRIGYKEVPTIYPPFAQAVFAASNFIKRDSILAMKSLFVLFDILAIFVIYKMLLFLKMNPNNVIVYAWSPLVLKEFSNSGHLDPIAIFFLLLAVFFVFRNNRNFSMAALSVGMLSKFFPVVALPLFLKKIRWRPLLWVIVIVGAGYLPFLLMGNILPARVFTGLFTYAREWAINGGIFELLYSIFYASNIKPGLSIEIFTKIIAAIIYLAALFFISRKHIDSERVFLYRVFLAVAFLFLLSPVGDPWYFCWVIPFLCFFPYFSFIMLSWLLIFSYLSFTKDFDMVPLGPLRLDPIVLAQYTPFFILLFFEGLCLKVKKSR